MRMGGWEGGWGGLGGWLIDSTQEGFAVTLIFYEDVSIKCYVEANFE